MPKSISRKQLIHTTRLLYTVLN